DTRVYSVRTCIVNRQRGRMLCAGCEHRPVIPCKSGDSGGAMSTPVTRRRDNTRARLLEAATQGFAAVGLEGATVEAVCERAGFSRGAFYANVESKDELFLTLAASVGEARLSAVRERVSDLVSAEALEGCDPVELVQQIMDSGADDRLGVMMMSEI